MPRSPMFGALREAVVRIGWLVVAGLVLYLLGQAIEHPFWHGLFLAAADAAFVAFFIAISVEWWFRRAITRDVFIAVLGRIVPPGVVSEIKVIVQGR